MAEKIPMIALSPTMEEGTIASWRKKEGEEVASGDVLAEVETDKATMDYESTSEGTLLKILVPEGGAAKVGQPIAILGRKGEDIGELLKEAAPPAQAPPAAAGPTPPPEAAAPAAAQPSPAPAPPAAAAGAAPGPAAAAPAPGPAAPAAPAGGGGGREEERLPGGVRASPLARRLAEERGVDLRALRGSGPAGRIVLRDVERAAPAGARQAPGAPAAPAAAPARPAPAAPGAGAAPAVGQAPPPPAPPRPGADTRVRVAGKRKVTAQRMSQSMFSAPHYYLRIDVEADNLLEARRRLNATLPPSAEGGRPARVSLNAFLLKFTAEALKRHPEVNATWEGETILRYGSVDIGLAVALPDGLVAPVVRGCGEKGIVAISAEIDALVEKARANRLSVEELGGATFTVSNLGAYGILDFTAIINPPGSAILAVGRIHRVPVILAAGGEDSGGPRLQQTARTDARRAAPSAEERIAVRSQMILTLSCDHRVIDGAVGAAFLSDLKGMLEDPIRVLY